MKNFLFISPNFPENYWMFCRELKKNGLNVLGIGDQPYEELSQGLKDSLDEYYKVSSLENEEEVYRAVAFLIFKHGRIDWLESIMNTGLKEMQGFVQHSTSQADSRRMIFRGSNINPG